MNECSTCVSASQIPRAVAAQGQGLPMDSVFAWVQGLGSSELKVHEVDDESAKCRIKIVPALSDNYMYLAVNVETREAVAVDPVEPQKILELCKSLEVRLVAVLTTHYHSDHSGGNKALSEMVPELEVVAGELDADRTPAVTRRVKDGETCSFAGLPFRCLATPCHTVGHVSFVLEQDPPSLFCGDTLFVAGCGRFMEGSAATMHQSLQALVQLPKKTRVFCGHEYTVPNLEYALSLEPGSAVLRGRLEEAKERRKAKEPTVPSTLEEELQHNPFLRCHEPQLARAVGLEASDVTEVLGKLRRGKDTFTTVGSIITLALDVKSYFKPVETPEISV
ncbi:unnamed protein product [Effrenium voratum]|uniref:hydroxyacylglutathione hydrolase n=2 Tax=Effrenium voratum TaxID=2562239 RepID=A0AA36IZ10_9DINO|nr:unnamed protein product [Effrenium voratum]